METSIPRSESALGGIRPVLARNDAKPGAYHLCSYAEYSNIWT